MAALDAAVMGLRLNAGIDVSKFRTAPTARRGIGLRVRSNWASEAGLLERDGAQLRLTQRGRRLANEVFVRMMEPDLV